MAQGLRWTWLNLTSLYKIRKKNTEKIHSVDIIKNSCSQSYLWVSKSKRQEIVSQVLKLQLMYLKEKINGILAI